MNNTFNKIKRVLERNDLQYDLYSVDIVSAVMGCALRHYLKDLSDDEFESLCDFIDKVAINDDYDSLEVIATAVLEMLFEDEKSELNTASILKGNFNFNDAWKVLNHLDDIRE